MLEEHYRLHHGLLRGGAGAAGLPVLHTAWRSSLTRPGPHRHRTRSGGSAPDRRRRLALVSRRRVGELPTWCDACGSIPPGTIAASRALDRTWLLPLSGTYPSDRFCSACSPLRWWPSPSRRGRWCTSSTRFSPACAPSGPTTPTLWAVKPCRSKRGWAASSPASWWACSICSGQGATAPVSCRRPPSRACCLASSR